MKTMITTTLTFLTALLTIGLIGINNNNNINNSNSIGTVFAQTDPEDPSMVEDMEMDDEGMTMSNQSEGMKMTNLNGTIDVETTIAEAFKSKITTNITEAIQ